MHDNRHLASLGLATLLVLGGSCSRLADEDYDFEALKIAACMATCDTFDTCEPDRFAGMEPEDCFERCMTLLPNLHEENQCGSREIIYLQCLGELSCAGLAEYTVGNDYSDGGVPDYTAPCVSETEWSATCSDDRPFDLDEPVSSYP